MLTSAQRSFRHALILTAAVAALAAPAAHAVAVDARLVAPPGSEAELKSTISLEVRALPAALNQPVAKGALLVQMDLTKLQKELEGEQKTLASAQEEKRRLAVQRGATSSSPASNSRVDMQNAQNVSDAQMAESNAISDIARLQKAGAADDDVDPHLAAAALCAMVEGFGRHWYGRDGGADDDLSVTTLTTLWARGLGIRTTGAPPRRATDSPSRRRTTSTRRTR